MQVTHHPLLSPALGTQRHLTSFTFGRAGSGTKAYIQASLHADELPGMLVAHHLRVLLEAAEQRGEIEGEVVLVPMANPIGLSQTVMHHQIGRFELASMENFNRNYPDFFELLKVELATLLGPDAETNKRTIRAAMRRALLAQTPRTELQSQRQTLMLLSHDADLVLDLHCDFEAVMHLYVEQACLERLEPLAHRLGARALLWANGSGGSVSFDEALSGPWWRLRDHFADRAPVPLGCASTTVELRGLSDVSTALAQQDARAIYDFLQSESVVSGFPAAPPAAQCEATPLAGTESVLAPHSGVIAFACQAGEVVRAGQLLAEVVDPLSGQSSAVKSGIDGVMYARHNLRWATTGFELCRIAGREPIRSGNLLSP
jgi:predicted deacylase